MYYNRKKLIAAAKAARFAHIALCECSESYRHRGQHTPGCPADNGER